MTTQRTRIPRGDGSIQELPNGKYKVQIDEQGRQRKKSFTGST